MKTLVSKCPPNVRVEEWRGLFIRSGRLRQAVRFLCTSTETVVTEREEEVTPLSCSVSVLYNSITAVAFLCLLSGPVVHNTPATPPPRPARPTSSLSTHTHTLKTNQEVTKTMQKTACSKKAPESFTFHRFVFN